MLCNHHIWCAFRLPVFELTILTLTYFLTVTARGLFQFQLGQSIKHYIFIYIFFLLFLIIIVILSQKTCFDCTISKLQCSNYGLNQELIIELLIKERLQNIELCSPILLPFLYTCYKTIINYIPLYIIFVLVLQ